MAETSTTKRALAALAGITVLWLLLNLDWRVKHHQAQSHHQPGAAGSAGGTNLRPSPPPSEVSDAAAAAAAAAGPDLPASMIDNAHINDLDLGQAGVRSSSSSSSSLSSSGPELQGFGKSWRHRFSCEGMEEEKSADYVVPKYKGYANKYCGPGKKNALWASYTDDEYRQLVLDFCEPLDLEDGMSIFESGMGCGGIFTHLRPSYPGLSFGGIDASPDALSYANEIFKDSKHDFKVRDVRHLEGFADGSYDRAVTFGVLQSIGYGIMAGGICRPKYPWARPCKGVPQLGAYGATCGKWGGSAKPWCFCEGCEKHFQTHPQYAAYGWDYCADEQTTVSCSKTSHATPAFVARLEHAERHMCCTVREMVRIVKPGGKIGFFGVFGDACRWHPSSWVSKHGAYLDDDFWLQCLPDAAKLRKISYYGGKYCPEYYSIIVTK